GLRDVRRMQRAKGEQSHDTKGKGRGAEEEYDQPHQEKQRLLERESAQSADSLMDVRVIPRDHSQQESAEHVEEIPSSQSIVSPTIEQTGIPGTPTVVSEKARGKMRERSVSLETDNSLDRVTAAAVGRNGFVPTQEWVTSWQQGCAPLDPVMIVISEL
ncbi:hypothetical protein F5148DRAFT_968580, partial [Russula earlei]